MMQIFIRFAVMLLGSCALGTVALDIWGAVVLGTHKPAPDAVRDDAANNTVMVFGATGSAGDGLLKAAMQDTEVQAIYAVTRHMSPRLKAGTASGRVQVIMQRDFTDYTALGDTLKQVNTVLWGLGTSSVGMDEAVYRRIHVDFPVAFVKAWLAARSNAPMAFHYITGMGTGEEQRAQWARDKGRAEREIAAMAQGTGLRTFAHRSAWIRPVDAPAKTLMDVAQWLLTPGYLVIQNDDLGRAMLEISARTEELPNGALIDNKDAIAYADAYNRRQRELP